MSDIVFRGKLIDNGEWVEGWFCEAPFGRWPLRPSIIPAEKGRRGCFVHLEVDPETVGQYTGLLDKNGKKIFEGDVIVINGHDDFRIYVAFDRNEWVGKSKRYPYYRCHLDFGRESYEVIGNIHDNPKLLEEKA